MRPGSLVKLLPDVGSFCTVWATPVSTAIDDVFDPIGVLTKDGLYAVIYERGTDVLLVLPGGVGWTCTTFVEEVGG